MRYIMVVEVQDEAVVVGVRDEAVLEATNTFAAEQEASGEAAEDPHALNHLNSKHIYIYFH
jgi:flagellar biogenesis protein FliO